MDYFSFLRGDLQDTVLCFEGQWEGKIAWRKALYMLYIYTNVKIGKIWGGKILPILPKSGPNEGKQGVILGFMQKIYRIFAKYT